MGEGLPVGWVPVMLHIGWKENKDRGVHFRSASSIDGTGFNWVAIIHSQTEWPDLFGESAVLAILGR